MYGRISDPGTVTYPPRGALALCTIPSQSAIGQCGAGVSTPCGAVSTRRITILVSRLSALYMRGRIYDPGMPNYPPRGALMALRTISSQSAIGQCGAGVSTPCGAVSTRRITVFVPRL